MVDALIDQPAEYRTRAATGDVIVFDIETGPAPVAEIEALMPEFEAPGNLKDPAKIEAAIEKKREDFIEKAALNPMTGRVLAIGAWIDGEYDAMAQHPEAAKEAEVIEWFWARVSLATTLIGFNSNAFDLPFLYRRSWALGLHPPERMTRHGRFDADLHVDLLERWRLGDRNLFVGLDTLARFFGVGAKTGEGAHFSETFANDPDAAMEYLRNDVELTCRIADQMGVIDYEKPPGLSDDFSDDY